MSADVSPLSSLGYSPAGAADRRDTYAPLGTKVLGWHCIDDHMVLDPKWRLIARRAGATVSQVRDVFLHMMSDASLSQLGGEMASWNDEVIAINMDVETEVVTRIKEAMQALVVEGNTLKAWDRRQPKRDYSTARVRDFRARQAATAQGAPALIEVAEGDAVPRAEVSAVIVAPPQPDPPLSGPPIVIEPPQKPSRAKPRRQISEDEQPDARQRQDASDAGLSIAEFRVQWGGFRDHHRSKGTVSGDWPASWRTWLRKMGSFESRAQTSVGHESNFAKATRELLGEIENVTTGPGQVTTVASTLPDSAFRIAGYEGFEGDRSSTILDLVAAMPEDGDTPT